MENKGPLVSVIIPTHNRPEFLAQTLRSVIDQRYKNIEIIVISNGFNELNRNVTEEINDFRIRYIEQENSGGPSSPRNHGIRKSRGEYIAFCDDDDIWMPDKIEKQVHVLENNLEYGLCYSKMLRFDHEKEWSVTHEEGPADLKSLLYINTVPISAVLIKKSLLERCGNFSESKRIGTSEDYEFLLRYAAITKFYFLDEYLIKYWSGASRTTDNQMSIVKLAVYVSQIFACYDALRGTGKVKWISLVLPILYNTNLFLKGCIYQILVKIKMVKV
jgi:glycosyltransferase domain-containing protein